MQNLYVFLPVSFQGKIAGVCFGFELAFFLLDVFLVGSINVLLQVSPNVSANLSKEITWCLPGSTHCLFFQYLSNGFDAFCLSWFSIVSFCQCLPDENPADVFLDWALRLPMSLWWAQSMSSAKCLPMSFAKSVYRSHLMSFRIYPQSFFWYLSGGSMCSVWAGSQFCQCLSAENPASVCLGWALCLQMSF